MLDNDAIRLRAEALADGRVIDAKTYERLIIPWGVDCCRGCEFYDDGKRVTSHGFCSIQHRKVSPHYYCDRWVQD